MIKLLLWINQPGQVDSGAIAFLTHGNVTHAGFLRGSGKVHELSPPGVHDRDLLDSERLYVHAFSLDGMTDEMAAQLERLFDLNIEAGIKYSYFDLLRYEFNIAQDGDQQSYCSRYVMHCLGMCRCPLPLARCTQDQVTPWDLWRSPILTEGTL
jgi:hypothetical protein